MWLIQENDRFDSEDIHTIQSQSQNLKTSVLPFSLRVFGLFNIHTNLNHMDKLHLACTRAVWKVRGLVAVRHCYAERGGDCYVKLWWWG
jgi:hypothetical protein